MGFMKGAKMKFTSSTQDFLTACSKAARATGKKQFETSEMLLIEAHGPYGIATGYDLTLGISAPFGIVPGGDGKIAVDAKILCGILKKAPSEIVSFETSGDDVTIKAGRSRFTVKGVSADSFPQIPEIEGDSIEVNADELNRLTRLTSFAAAVKDLVYSHKDEIIDKVVDRAVKEMVRKGLPKLLERGIKNDE